MVPLNFAEVYSFRIFTGKCFTVEVNFLVHYSLFCRKLCSPSSSPSTVVLHQRGNSLVDISAIVSFKGRFVVNVTNFVFFCRHLVAPPGAATAPRVALFPQAAVERCGGAEDAQQQQSRNAHRPSPLRSG